MEVYKGKSDFIALCYAQQNRDAAAQILERLNQARFRVWTNDRGCNPKKKADAVRLAESRVALILISKDWITEEKYTNQLRGAAHIQKQTVLVFLDDTDMSKHEELNLLLNRSVRMFDFKADAPEECMENLMSLECIQECKMADGEEPDTENTGLIGFLSRDITDLT